ncbi:MAG: alpha/beta fold hydrolase [Vicinamibacteria bacterium]|nr:alpha/beta fold hydrolase [Vicinamibacteria bacterium]
MSWRSLFPFASHTLDTPGGRLRYLDEGPRDAPVLLCVHGNPTWSFLWRDVVSEFRASHRVVAPDHLGCGLSDKPQNWGYRLADHIDNLGRLIENLDLQRITLLVHDWGGPIGLGAALAEPARVERLVITNTGAFPAPGMPARIAACRLPLLGPLAVRGFNAFSWAATFMTTVRGLPPDVAEGYLYPYRSWADRVAVQRFVEDIPLDPGHPSWPTLVGIAEGLQRLADRPGLILWGEQDWCFTPWFRREFERRLPRLASHPFADAGHLVIEDARGRVLGLLHELLDTTA